MKRNAENPNLAERMERLKRQTTLLLLTVVVQTAILFVQYRRIGFALDSLSQLYIYTYRLSKELICVVYIIRIGSKAKLFPVFLVSFLLALVCEPRTRFVPAFRAWLWRRFRLTAGTGHFRLRHRLGSS